MSDLTEITTLVRYMIQDTSETMKPGDIFTYGSSAIFTLSESNVISITSVLHNDSELSDSEYSFDSTNNKLTVSSALLSGDIVEIQYSFYPNYSDTEIQNYIRNALIHLCVNNYYTFELDVDGTVHPDISEKEQNFIAYITSILINPNNESYSLPDLRITVPKDLPTYEKIKRAVRYFKSNTTGHWDLAN